MSLLKVNEVQNYNGSSLTLTASTVSTSAQLNTGGNISVTGSINVSDDSTTRSNLGLGSIATQAAGAVNIDGGAIDGTTIGGTTAAEGTFTTFTSTGIDDNGTSTVITIDSGDNVTIGSTPVINRLYGSSGNPLYGLVDKVLVIGDSTDTVNHRLGIAFGPNERIGSGIFANNVNAGADEDTNLEFYVQKEGQVNARLAMTINEDRNVSIVGSLSKGSGSFKINHPLNSKSETHHLVHSFIEGPQADLIYRGKVDLVDGSATVNIDTAAGMTEGTFVTLNREVQCFTSNESDWDAVRGSVSGNILTIECQNAESTATISWLVIGERQDPHMYDTEWTDENGKVIVEPLKEIEALETA